LNKIFFIVFGLIAVASVAGLSTEFVNFDVQDFQFFGSFTEFEEAVCTCEGDDGTVSKENCEQFAGDITDINGVCVLHPDVDIGDYGVLPPLDQGCGVSFWISNADESQVLSIWPAGYNPDDSYNDLFKTTIVSENENKDKDEDKVRDEDKLNQKDKDEVKDEDKVRDEDKLNQKDKDEVKDEDKVRDEDSQDDDTDKGLTLREALHEKDKDEVKDEDKVRDEDSQDDDTDKGLTLREALNEKGGKMGNILRASVAALLNSAHSEVSYQYPVQEVISMTLDAINNENYQDAIDIFEEHNEQGVRPPLCEDFDENINIPNLNTKN